MPFFFFLTMAYNREHKVRIRDLEALANTFNLAEMYDFFSTAGLYVDSDGDIAQLDNDEEE